MKAEVRKQLETNSLADQMNRLVHGGYKSASAIWVLLGVAVVVGILYWWLAGTLAARSAEAWSQVWFNQGFIAAAEGNLKSGPAGLAAELLAADKDFEIAGFSLLTDARTAEEKFLATAERYARVAEQATSSGEVRLRALVGAAKSYETAGRIPEAVSFYQAANAEAERRQIMQHPLAIQSRAANETLTASDGEGRAFYKGWPDRLPKSQPEPSMEAPKPPQPPTPPEPVDPFNMPTAPEPKPGAFVPPAMTAPAGPGPLEGPPSPPPATAPAGTTPGN